MNYFITEIEIVPLSFFANQKSHIKTQRVNAAIFEYGNIHNSNLHFISSTLHPHKFANYSLLSDMCKHLFAHPNILFGFLCH